ncbi:MAG TPA: LuxR C-terminal-related transcriptional regulator, partial [Capillimicrobium sp.]
APVGFVHPLVRDAVYHEMAPSERELRHERAAAALAELGARPEAVAVHLMLTPARADARVAALLRDAGSAAGRRGDVDSAVSYLRRALDEPCSPEDRPGLLLELGRAEALLNLPGAVEHLREGHAHVEDPLERAESAELLVRTLIFTRPAGEAVAAARDAVAALPEELVDQRQALEALELHAPKFGAPPTPEGAARLTRARGRVEGDGPGAKMALTAAAWDWALAGGSATDVSRLALDALDSGTLAAADPVLMAGAPILVLALADHDEALDQAALAEVQARRIGSPFGLSGIHFVQAWCWLVRGELDEAADALQRVIETAGPWTSTVTGYTVTGLAHVAIERGDLALAEQLLAGRGPQPPGSDGDRLCHTADAKLCLAQGRWADAQAAAEACAAGIDPRVVNPAWLPWRSLKGLALDGLGDRGEAQALLERDLAAARAWGAPRTLSRTLRLLGTVSGGPEGLGLLHEAVAVAEGSPARLEHAKGLLALGAALRRGRQPASSRDPLRRAFASATRCGATPVAEQARAELLAAGARPRREALTGAGSLTPSELRVARLAADGASNRDIAQGLFVTPKTVEVHLTSAYRKLGIAGRGSLRDALPE